MSEKSGLMQRCDWPGQDQLMLRYHDEEWGTPLHTDQKLFEFLVLDAFQAGLSWKTVLHRREAFRRAFDDFDPQKIANYNEIKVADLLADVSIIRNRLKINASVSNAKAFLKVQQQYGSFDGFIWQFTDGKTIHNAWKHSAQVPARSLQSDTMSKALTGLGFRFVGSTICYAFMQAAGLVNDHLVGCFRYGQLTNR